MKARLFVSRTLVTLAVFTSACDDPAGPVDTGSIVAVQIDSVSGPIIRTITVQLETAAPIEVTYGAQGTPVLTMSADSSATQHRVILPRLRAGRTYTVEVTVPSDESSMLRTSFGTGVLPPELAGIALLPTGSPAYPVSLVEVAQAENFFGLLIVEGGQIVGYQKMAGPLFGSTRRANGHIVLLDNALGLVSRRLDGSIAHRLPQRDSAPAAPYGRIHHDVTATPSNTLLFIATEVQPVGGVQITGEALWEWNPETGTVVKRWSAFDHLTWTGPQPPRSNAGNWLHGNGIKYGPRGNVIMSLRNINQVISIAPDFSRLEWKLGGLTSTLAVAEANRFSGQHYVSEPTLNHLLIYDNGFEQLGGQFTRVIEYRIDVAAATATPVWQYRPSPEIYAALVGSAQRLPNGNTIVLFGMRYPDEASTGPMNAVEVNSAGNVIWRLAFDEAILARIYRLTPVASLIGERAGAFRD